MWAWLNGKKTIFAAVLFTLEKLLLILASLLGTWGLDAAQVAGIVGFVTALVGLGHKAYKWAYAEEHPED